MPRRIQAVADHGARARRRRRYAALNAEAARLPVHDALPLYQQMRLLFPRRAFPALRFGDAADAAGQNQVSLSLFLSDLPLALMASPLPPSPILTGHVSSLLPY